MAQGNVVVPCGFPEPCGLAAPCGFREPCGLEPCSFFESGLGGFFESGLVETGPLVDPCGLVESGTVEPRGLVLLVEGGFAKP